VAMNDTQRSLIRDLSTSPGTFWCVHLPQIAPAEREPLKQEALVYLLNNIGVGQLAVRCP
jgi:hypothetical protein